MPNFWETQPRQQYNRRQRRLFETYARSHAYNESSIPKFAGQLNLPPQMFRQIPTKENLKSPLEPADTDSVQAPPSIDWSKIPEWARPKLAKDLNISPPKEQKKQGGILGLAGDIAEGVGLTDIKQPWDVLRPVKRLMDLEQKYIAKPITEEIYSSGPVTKALGLDYDLNSDVPGIVKWGTEMAVSPSTWLGPGAIVGGIKGIKNMAWAAPTIASMAVSPGSRRAFASAMPSIGGGGGTDLLEKFLKRVAASGDDMIRAQNMDEVIDHAVAHKSLTRLARGQLDRLLTPQQHSKILDTIRRVTRTGIEDIAGVRLFDGPIGPAIGEYQRIHNLGNNWAAMAVDGGLRGAAKRSGIMMDSQGERILDPDLITQATKVLAHKNYKSTEPLFIEDLVTYSNRFNLSPQQKLFIDAYKQHHTVYRGTEKAARISISERRMDEDLIYVHHERIKQPVEIGQYDDAGNRIGSVKDTRTLGQVVNARLGGRQTASMPREFETKLEGWRTGIEYLPFFEAQRARMQQGVKLIADNWLDNALSMYGKTPTELVDPVLMQRGLDLAKTRAQGLNIGRRLDEAIRHSNAKTKSWRALNARFYKELPPELKSIADRAAHVSENVSTKKLRTNDFTALRDELNKYLGPVVQERTNVGKQIREAKALASAQGAGEFTERFAGRFYDPKIGQVLNRELAPMPATGIEQGMQKLNDLARPLMATLDASFLGIQGLVAFSHNPQAWTVAMKNAMFGGYDTYIEKAMRSGIADDFIRHNGFYAAKNDFGDFITPPIISKLPIVGKGAEISGTWWTNFGNVLRLEMWKNATGNGLKKLSDTDKDDLAKLINNATGYSSSPITRMERIGEFAPRFFRSQFGILADAVTKNNLSGNKAKLIMAQLIGEGAILTATVNELSGSDIDWWNPDSYNFMRMRIADNDVSVFGPWDTLARMVIKGIPFDLNIGDEAGIEFDPLNPFQGAAYAARVKASPVMGRIYDLIEGETFTGEQVRDFSSPTAIAESLATIAKGSLLPISAQNLINEGSLTPSYLPVMGAEMAGIKSSPKSQWEALAEARNSLAQQNYQRDWSDLEPWERYEIIQDNPDLEYKDNEDAASAARNAIGERFSRKQERIDELYSGQDWITAYQKNMADRSGAYGQWEAEHPEAAAELRNKKPKNANEAALKQYYDFFDQADEQALLPEEIAEGLEELKATFSPEQLGYVERNTGFKNTPKVLAYREAQAKLKPYWRIEEQFWDKLKSNGRVTENSFDEYVDTRTQILLEKGISPELIGMAIQRDPLVKAMEGAVDTARKRLRIQNPEIDKLLVEWYGYPPVRYVMANR